MKRRTVKHNPPTWHLVWLNHCINDMDNTIVCHDICNDDLRIIHIQLMTSNRKLNGRTAGCLNRTTS